MALAACLAAIATVADPAAAAQMGPPAPLAAGTTSTQASSCDPATGPCGDSDTGDTTDPDPVGAGGAPPEETGGTTGKVGPQSLGDGGVSPPATQTQPPHPDEPLSADSDSTGSADSGGVTPSGDGDSGPLSGAQALDVTPLSVPNFLIDQFEIPPFLLPIYQACGTEYAIPWQVLAAINRMETDFGRLNGVTSTAGAEGWMQFMPATWSTYGLDANGDGKKDPYNPVDAICAAARYLRAAGGNQDLSTAIFAYNHADWYVNDVLGLARGYSKIPEALISSLTGLTEGARFPVAAKSTYAGQISTDRTVSDGNPASEDDSSSPKRRTVVISSRPDAPVIAVNDGIIKRITGEKDGSSKIVLEDAYGNRFIYSGLGSIAKGHPVPDLTSRADDVKPLSPPDDKAPTQAATGPGDASTLSRELRQGSGGGGPNPKPEPQAQGSGSGDVSSDAGTPDADGAPEEAEPNQPTGLAGTGGPAGGGEPRVTDTENARQRTYAMPLRPHNQSRSRVDGASDDSYAATIDGGPGDYVIYNGSGSGALRYDPDTTELRPLREGSRVVAGTVLGRLADDDGASMGFAIRPAGKKAPEIDPKPFLDGWRLLAESDIYNANGANRFADRLGVGGVLLLSKPALQRRVLMDPGIDIYPCGRQDIAGGLIDRRVLALLAYLSEKGYRMTITSLECGHGVMSVSGLVSEHSTGDAVDIAVINGVPVTGHQGPGTVTDSLIRSVLQLQGNMQPHQVISLMDFPGPISFAMADHYNHVHVGYRPVASQLPAGDAGAVLGAEQWKRLTQRLDQIQNPQVGTGPSGRPGAGG